MEITNWFISPLVFAVGLVCWGITYIGAPMASKKSGKYVSGIPGMAFMCLLIAGMMSPCKWLAFLCLLDVSITILPYYLINEYVHNKSFEKLFENKQYNKGVRDDKRVLVVRIPERKEELRYHYITNYVYTLSIPKIWFSVCTDKAQNRLLLVNASGKRKSIDIVPFDQDIIRFEQIRSKKTYMTVEFEIKDKDTSTCIKKT